MVSGACFIEELGDLVVKEELFLVKFVNIPCLRCLNFL